MLIISASHPSIHLRILKRSPNRRALGSVACFTPFDPSADTETLFCVYDSQEIGDASHPSIHLRILKLKALAEELKIFGAASHPSIHLRILKPPATRAISG